MGSGCTRLPTTTVQLQRPSLLSAPLQRCCATTKPSISFVGQATDDLHFQGSTQDHIKGGQEEPGGVWGEVNGYRVHVLCIYAVPPHTRSQSSHILARGLASERPLGCGQQVLTRVSGTRTEYVFPPQPGGLCRAPSPSPNDPRGPWPQHVAAARGLHEALRSERLDTCRGCWRSRRGRQMPRPGEAPGCLEHLDTSR